jgi:tetratricopeptide (TPR) repeat protein
MEFFERFRAALRRYAEGVHRLEPPATAAAIDEAERSLGRPLPPAYRDFLLQWNGGELFHDDYVLFGAGGPLSVERGLIRFGEAADSLGFDERGRVVAVDPESEPESGVGRVEGSSFGRWLEALVARESLLYDRDGEFREDAFEGAELTARVRRKRAQAAVRADPESPAWREELAAILVEDERPGEAAAELERAVALEPALASAWFSLGRLRRDAADPGGAADAFRRAAEAEHEPEEAAFAFAHAARAAVEAGRADASELGARVAGRMPTFVAQQAEAARHLIEEGSADEAIERLALALAVAPADAALAQLLARARARAAIKLV